MEVETKYLGHSGTKYEGLEAIQIQGDTDLLRSVTLTSDEVTSVCPKTGQPDFYEVSIEYIPSHYICESKSLKLYFQSLRNEGIFCEDLASRILEEFWEPIMPLKCEVRVTQKPRGGISIVAVAKKQV